jgi:hypothetical protein
MAILYVDLVNGNDSSNGITFATRKKTISNAYSALGSYGYNPPDGHEIRVMGQDITEVGTGTLYTHQQSGGAFSGATAITTGLNPTVTYNNHPFVEDAWLLFYSTQTNDRDIAGYRQIKNVTQNTFDVMGANNAQATLSNTGGIYSVSRNIIYLDTPVTKTLVSTRRNSAYDISYGDEWIPSTGVTWTYNTTGYSKIAMYSDKFVMSTSAVAGKLAYHTFSSTLDLSAYQQLSFEIYQGGGISAGTTYYYSICLCSDTTGDTVVNEFIIPDRNGSKYTRLTVDYGSSLGSSIQSIAIYKYGAANTANFYISNVIACKAPSEPDSLTLQSLIGTGDGNWYNIVGIDERVVIISSYHQDSTITGSPGHGESIDGTATLYKIEPYYIRNSSTFTNYMQFYSNYTSSATSVLKISGGWNTTDMSTQDPDGLTFIASIDNNGRFTYGASTQYLQWDSIGMVNFYVGHYLSSSICKGWKFTNCTFLNCYDYSIQLPNSGENYFFDGCKFICNRQAGVYFQRSAGCKVYNTTGLGNNTGNFSYGIFNVYQANDILIDGVRAVSCKQNPIYLNYSTRVKINNVNVMHYGTGNSSNYRGVSMQNASNVTVKSGILTVRDTSFTGANLTNVSVDGVTINNTNGSSLQGDISAGPGAANKTLLGMTNFYHNDRTGIVTSYIAGSYSVTESDGFTSTGSGFSYRSRITSSNVTSEDLQQEIPLAQVLVSSGSTVSIAASVYRTGAGINYNLFCPEGQQAGLGYTGSTATQTVQWERVSFDFVPTETGVIEIVGGMWATSSTQEVYFDNLEVSQG